MTGADRGVAGGARGMLTLKWSAFYAARGSVLTAIGAILVACAPIQLREPLTPASALPPTQSGELAERVASLNLREGQSSYRLLQSNSASLLLLIRTAEAAVSSLDLMYYAWHDDISGRLLASELLRAADRGVRVRLIVDDVSVRHLDADLALLDTHPNMEIRHFNPLRSRDSLIGNVFEMVFSGGRPNYRMHQKAWIVDGHVALVGGRNIGDAYFDLGEEFNFRDLGVLVTGTAVEQSSAAFDQYWNSNLVIPISVIHDEPLTVTLLQAQAALERERKETLSQPPVRELLESSRTGEKRNIGVEDTIGDGAVMITDPPDKGARARYPLLGVAAEIRTMGERARRELIIVSPYFVPGKEGARWLEALEARGVQVSVLTNSLNATDVAAVHGGYTRYRKRLLKAGVEIHELKPSALGPGPRHTLGGSSRSSLHTKAVIADARYSMVGSFNYDPRSTWLNTEMGVVIDDPFFAERVRTDYRQALDPRRSYRLALEGTRLVWIDNSEGKERRQYREPSSSWKRRGIAILARLLPVENQL